MKFGRRHDAGADLGARTVEDRLAGPVDPPADRGSGTYRVAVVRLGGDDAPAHWGPAYNAAFAELVAHVRDVPVGDVDLFAEAQRGAGRCIAEHGDGWVAWVERLRASPSGDCGEWEKVA